LPNDNFQGRSYLAFGTMMSAANEDSLAQIQLPKYLQSARVLFVNKCSFFDILSSVLVLKENKTKCKEKRRFLKELHVQVWVVQRYQPIHNKIVAIDLMLEK
jgi:hypothetical protein